MNLYFEEPNSAVIKIDGKIIYNFPCLIRYEKPLVIEYSPTTNDFLPFTKILKVKNGKLITYQELHVTLYSSDLISVSYQPKINVINAIETVQKLDAGRLSVAIIKTDLYNLVFYDNDVKKVITLPSYVKFPKVERFGDKLVILASTVNDKKYFGIISLIDLSVKLGLECDEVCSDERNIIIKQKYSDTMKRTANYLYSYSEVKLTDIQFEYGEKETNNIGKLFIEAYLACDVKKLNEYSLYPISYFTLREYLGDIVLLSPPFETDKTLIGYKTDNVTIVKSVDFNIINDKIENFEIK